MKTNKMLASAMALALTTMSAQALADTTEDLINALVTKGVLTEDEGALLSKANDKKVKNTPTLSNKGGKFTMSSADGKNEMAITGRLHFDTLFSDIDNDDIGGVKTQYGSSEDWSDYDVDGKSVASDGEFLVRRARLGVKGKLDDIWKYAAVADFSKKGKAKIDEFSLKLVPSKSFYAEAGQFKQAFNLEGLTSSNDIDMVERSWINQISPHKKLGFGIGGEIDKKSTWMATVYQHNYNDTDTAIDKGFSGRLTHNFAPDKDSIFHLGISGFTEDYSQTPKTSSNGINATTTTATGNIVGTTHAALFNFKSSGNGLKPLASLQMSGAPLTNGGASQYGKVNLDVERKFGGLEAIVAKGPFKLQGEYTAGDYQANDGGVYGNTAEADINIGYITAGWILTGESYAGSYKGGKFKGLKPASTFNFENGKGIGLWELTARYQHLNIDNMWWTTTGDYNETRFRGANPTSGSVHESYTQCTSSSKCSMSSHMFGVGLKWIANPNVLVKWDVEYTDFGSELDPADIGAKNSSAAAIDSETLATMRVQYMF